MKKILILLGFYSTFLSAQCERTATNFGNNSNSPSYNIRGTVTITLNTNNTITITTGSNFSTAAGGDVRLFLVDRGTLTDEQLKTFVMFDGRPKISFGVTMPTGAQTYTQTIPAGINVNELDTVYFFCQRFSAFWDFGKIVEFTTANCSVLDNETFETSNTSIYPNPVENQLFVDSKNITAFKVYNLTGSIVLQEENFKNESIDFSNLNSGLYIVELNENERTYRKTVVKK
jgi:Secretion system C-terminal sorting domain/Electron transfer DM13